MRQALHLSPTAPREVPPECLSPSIFPEFCSLQWIFPVVPWHLIGQFPTTSCQVNAIKGRSLSSRTGLTKCLSSSDSLAQSCLAAPSITKASIALCRWDGRLQVFLGNCWLSPTTSLVLLPLRPCPFDPKKLDSAQTVPRISQSPSFS